VQLRRIYNAARNRSDGQLDLHHFITAVLQLPQFNMKRHRQVRCASWLSWLWL
jgi:hypothetical protein